jgi:hypothetical protein
MFLESKMWRVRMADKLTTICVTRLSRQCGILNISQPYRSPRPVTGIVFLFYFTFYDIKQKKADGVNHLFMVSSDSDR